MPETKTLMRKRRRRTAGPLAGLSSMGPPPKHPLSLFVVDVRIFLSFRSRSGVGDRDKESEAGRRTAAGRSVGKG